MWVGVSALALLSVVAGGGLSGTGEPAPAKKEKKKKNESKLETQAWVVRWLRYFVDLVLGWLDVSGG